MMWDSSADSSGWGWMVAGMVIFWLLAVVAVVAFLWRLRESPARGAQADALRILDERLARGELEVGEYRELRDVLAGGHRAPR